MEQTQFSVEEIASLLGHKDLVIYDLNRKLEGALAEVKRLTIENGVLTNGRKIPPPHLQGVPNLKAPETE